jgi:hypothetical protein
MFQFPGFASLAGYQIFDLVGCPIRVLTDQGQCAAPRKLSQLVAPFFACESLGIPHAPFLTSFPPQAAGQYVCLPKMSKNLPQACTMLGNAGANGAKMCVEDNGFEPLTPCVQGRCSSQLS